MGWIHLLNVCQLEKHWKKVKGEKKTWRGATDLHLRTGPDFWSPQADPKWNQAMSQNWMAPSISCLLLLDTSSKVENTDSPWNTWSVQHFNYSCADFSSFSGAPREKKRKCHLIVSVLLVLHLCCVSWRVFVSREQIWSTEIRVCSSGTRRVQRRSGCELPCCGLGTTCSRWSRSQAQADSGSPASLQPRFTFSMKS